MKHIKLIFIAILAILALTSCEKAFDTNSVCFSNEGGTQTITTSSYVLSISDYDGNYGTSEDDSEHDIIHAEKDWLSATLDVNTGELTITAQKNDSGKKRKLYINGMKFDFASSITVVQEK